MNKVILQGNLIEDPTLIPTKSETTIARMRLAVDGKQTFFGSVKLFGKTAETAIQYLEKGRKVLVEARLENNNWEKDGQKVYEDEIVGEKWYFCDSKKKEDN